MANDPDIPRRLQPLLELLRWEGAISRGRVLEFSEVGGVRTSEWIRELRDLHPDWMSWDPVGRRYLATDALFRAHSGLPATRIEEGFAAYMSQTRSPTIHSDGESGMHVFPDFNVPAPRVFSTLKRCINDTAAVSVIYRSMRHPEPHQRIIEPHTLVRAGRRWHVRAWCRTSSAFRDFALGRIVSANDIGEPAMHGPSNDTGWTTMVEILLVPHPKLPPQQEEVVRFENFAGTSARRQTCRAALIAYLIQDVRAATDLERQRPPDYQIAVSNIEEIRAWLFPT